MINKKGYTLAEVLICIGIVSVLAALTIPRVIGSFDKKASGTSLGRTVELLQTGMANVLQEAQNNNDEGNAFSNLSAIRLSDIGLEGNTYITDGDNLFQNIISFINLTEDNTYNIENIKTYTGDDPSDDAISGYTAYRLAKTGSVVMYKSIDGEADFNDDNTILASILIDTNGNKAPNNFGKDIFLFGLANNGILIPAGTQAYFDSEDINPQTVVNGCSDTPGNGISCASRVMADKWEIKY